MSVGGGAVQCIEHKTEGKYPVKMLCRFETTFGTIARIEYVKRQLYYCKGINVLIKL